MVTFQLFDQNPVLKKSSEKCWLRKKIIGDIGILLYDSHNIKNRDRKRQLQVTAGNWWLHSFLSRNFLADLFYIYTTKKFIAIFFSGVSLPWPPFASPGTPNPKGGESNGTNSHFRKFFDYSRTRGKTACCPRNDPALIMRLWALLRAETFKAKRTSLTLARDGVTQTPDWGESLIWLKNCNFWM